MSKIRPKIRRTPNVSVKSLFTLKCHTNKQQTEERFRAILSHTHKFIRLKILGTAPGKLDLSIEISLTDHLFHGFKEEIVKLNE